jgi:rod shape determining protein RodA
MTLTTGVDLSPRTSRRGSIDFLLVFSVAALSAIGLLMVFSASAPRLEATGLSRSDQVLRQAAFMGAGAVVFVVASLISDRLWRMLAPVAFVATLLMLLVVLSPVGTAPTGAQRWIPLGFFNLQPSEIAKPAVILALAVLLSPPDDALAGVRWSRIGKALALVAVPAALIFVQPDLGTMLVFGFVSVVMLYVAGTSARQIGLLLVLGLIVLIVAFELNILEEYQLNRLTGFLNSGEQTLTLNYNQNQSQIAISAGGLFGRGLFEGSQTNLAFVPAQTTDFIFTAVGEQLGFVGGTLVLGLYSLLLWRVFAIGLGARDRFGRLIATGSAAMIGFHVFVNVGMAVGLLPVTGLPLPMMSYGGSFYVAMALTLGMVHSVWLRRSPVPGERQLL